MIYRFGHFELDTAQCELRERGTLRHTEPQVFALLALLIENRTRLVSRDEIIATVWGGRIVSDTAIASRIKSARAALGDDGRSQKYIRTMHRQGLRFVAEVDTIPQVTMPHAETRTPDQAETPSPSRPGIAVLPFRALSDCTQERLICNALPQDLITELSRLRWLFVIARASSFRFGDWHGGLDRVRTALDVRYGLTGTVEIIGPRIVVSVELCDMQSDGIVWCGRFTSSLNAIHEIRQGIIQDVINALEIQIPLNEARQARVAAPDQLDAWSHYHLGLHHMYRFTKGDNAIAAAHFERARSLAPDLARAYAGLSFTAFQNAFLGYVDDVTTASSDALRHAEACLERDPLDPFGNLTMGRALWLRDDLEASLAWLERANMLNPNYAQARYALGWTRSLIGREADSRTDIDVALALSPLDPLRYGMLGARALGHLGLGETEAAAEYAEQAAAAPGAHALIALIAVAALGLNGNDRRARIWADSARVRWPRVTHAEFSRAFPFRDHMTRTRITAALRRFGF